MDKLIDSLVNESNELQDKLIESRKKLSEGIVANTDKETEVNAIKKLTEEEEFKHDEEDAVEDEMRDDVETEADEDTEKDVEVEKQYFGQQGDTNYYLVGFESDEGISEDLQIVDQEGELVFSAKDNEVEITDVADFIIAAIQEIDVEDISYDVFEKYILPKLVEPEEEEEEFEDEEFEDEEEDLIPEEEEADTFEARIPYTYKDKVYEIKLLPECKIKVGGKVFSLTESTLNFYNIAEDKVTEKDLQDLAKDMLRAMDETELSGLKEGYEERSKRDGTGPFKGSARRAADQTIGRRKAAGEKCPAKEGVEDDGYNYGEEDEEVIKKSVEESKKIDEDITSDVKELQKKAEAAVKAGEYSKAADYVNRLAAVETSVGDLADDLENVAAVVDTSATEPEEDIVDDEIEETCDEEVEEITEQVPEDVKEQVDRLTTYLREGLNR